MKIAICDEDSNRLKVIKERIYKYADIKKFDMAVEGYRCGEELMVSGRRYNTVFLSYDLKRESSIRTAKKIKMKNPYTDIVFTSDCSENLFEALKVNPYGFLASPFDESEIFGFLEDYFAVKGCDYPFWVRSGNDTFCLNTREIFYLEADNKHCLVNLKDEFLRANCTMAKIYDVLPKNYFIKINRAYIVNLKYINRYNKDSVFLKNGRQLKISRKYSDGFKKAYRSFLNPLEL